MEKTPKIAIVSTVKGPLNELLMFINYHLNIGIDQIILFFDDPQDTCIDQIDAKYKNVHAVKCTEEYWLSQTSETIETVK